MRFDDPEPASPSEELHALEELGRLDDLLSELEQPTAEEQAEFSRGLS